MTCLVLLIDWIWARLGGCPWPLALILLLGAALAAAYDWRRGPKWCRPLLLGLAIFLLFGLFPRPLQSGPAQVSVEKGQRRLSVAGQQYKVGLGSAAEGTKLAEGDGRTPEGFYVICDKYPNGPYGPWLGLAYPSLADAWEARREGRFSWVELAIWPWRRTPPQSTRLGGQVGIHGGGSRHDWTLGCIALDNSDIRKVYDAVEVGAVVEVRP